MGFIVIVQLTVIISLSCLAFSSLSTVLVNFPKTSNKSHSKSLTFPNPSLPTIRRMVPIVSSFKSQVLNALIPAIRNYKAFPLPFLH